MELDLTSTSDGLCVAAMLMQLPGVSVCGEPLMLLLHAPTHMAFSHENTHTHILCMHTLPGACIKWLILMQTHRYTKSS